MSRSLRIVIAALGGEGGGVLADWLCHAAEASGYLSQTTSVPGVAQRTGATIYYLEIFPRAEVPDGVLPVMSLFPAPGDVDVAICSEIVEAGRMLQRGFITPDRTTVISSTHRTYGITEKAALADGTIDKDAIIAAVRESARWLVAFDMQALARQHGGVINSTLLGALGEAGALPFDRAAYVQAIESSGIAVKQNIACFDAAWERAAAGGGAAAGAPASPATTVEHFEPPREETPAPFSLPATVRSPELGALVERIRTFPDAAHEMLYLAVRKLCDYQDHHYAAEYLSRLEAFRGAVDTPDELLREVARHLGLWMAFEDLPRTAQLKISADRFDRFREEVQAGEEQPLHMVEFLHPRVPEFAGLMPAGLGRWALATPWARRVLGWFEGPRNIRTNSIPGFLAFYLLAAYGRWRRHTLAFQEEAEKRGAWLEAVESLARSDAEAALALARCARLVKGYSHTRERGHWQLAYILRAVEGGCSEGQQIEGLLDAAMVDDEARAFASRYKEVTGETLPGGRFTPASA